MYARSKPFPCASRHFLGTACLIIGICLTAGTDLKASGGPIASDDDQGVRSQRDDPYKDPNVSLTIEEVMDALEGQPDNVLDEAEYYYNYVHQNPLLTSYDPGKVALKLVQQRLRMGSKPVDLAVLFQKTNLSDCVSRPNLVAFGSARALDALFRDEATKEEREWFCQTVGEKLAELYFKQPRPEGPDMNLISSLYLTVVQEVQRELKERRLRHQ